MGMYVYGCDRCQNVCPRNIPWMAGEKPQNPRVSAKAANFDLTCLLHMDKPYFEKKIWPHMFYMSADDLWRWKMNAARAMGNSLNPAYDADLIRTFEENSDERVKSMIVWALGRIGNQEAIAALEQFSQASTGIVKEEIELALKSSAAKFK
jgi:epoxyqueuosine reductase